MSKRLSMFFTKDKEQAKKERPLSTPVFNNFQPIQKDLVNTPPVRVGGENVLDARILSTRRRPPPPVAVIPPPLITETPKIVNEEDYAINLEPNDDLNKADHANDESDHCDETITDSLPETPQYLLSSFIDGKKDVVHVSTDDLEYRSNEEFESNEEGQDSFAENDYSNEYEQTQDDNLENYVDTQHSEAANGFTKDFLTTDFDPSKRGHQRKISEVDRLVNDLDAFLGDSQLKTDEKENHSEYVKSSESEVTPRKNSKFQFGSSETEDSDEASSYSPLKLGRPSELDTPQHFGFVSTHSPTRTSSIDRTRSPLRVVNSDATPGNSDDESSHVDEYAPLSVRNSYQPSFDGSSYQHSAETSSCQASGGVSYTPSIADSFPPNKNENFQEQPTSQFSDSFPSLHQSSQTLPYPNSPAASSFYDNATFPNTFQRSVSAFSGVSQTGPLQFSDELIAQTSRASDFSERTELSERNNSASNQRTLMHISTANETTSLMNQSIGNSSVAIDSARYVEKMRISRPFCNSTRMPPNMPITMKNKPLLNKGLKVNFRTSSKQIGIKHGKAKSKLLSLEAVDDEEDEMPDPELKFEKKGSVNRSDTVTSYFTRTVRERSGTIDAAPEILPVLSNLHVANPDNS